MGSAIEWKEGGGGVRGAIGTGGNRLGDCLGGNWHGGNSPGRTVMEVISWGGNCPEGNCPGGIVLESKS